MSSEIMHQNVGALEAAAESGPSEIEFEMAYQARVAIDRIRFAIKHGEQFGQQSGDLCEAGLQLLDALERLETVDRRFQDRSRRRSASRAPKSAGEDGR
jgi:hypothetical protein